VGVRSDEAGMMAVRGSRLWFVLQHRVFTIKQQKWLGPQVRTSKMSAEVLRFLGLQFGFTSQWKKLKIENP